MRIEFSINHVIGKKEIIDKLKLVLFKSMIKMHKLAVINCHVDKGGLKSSINIFPFAPGYSLYNLVAGMEYAAAVEFGTSPHIIVPVKKQALAFKMDGKNVIVKKVMHPGSEAQPFMRPALDQVKGIWIKKYFDRVFAQKA